MVGIRTAKYAMFCIVLISSACRLEIGVLCQDPAGGATGGGGGKGGRIEVGAGAGGVNALLPRGSEEGQARPAITIAFPPEGDRLQEDQVGVFEVFVSESGALPEGWGLHLQLDGERIAEFSKEELIASGGIASTELIEMEPGAHALGALFASEDAKDDTSRRGVGILVEPGLDDAERSGGGHINGNGDDIADDVSWEQLVRGVVPAAVTPPGDIEGGLGDGDWSGGMSMRIVSPAPNSVVRAASDDDSVFLRIRVEADGPHCGPPGEAGSTGGAYIRVALDGEHTVASGGCLATVLVRDLKLGVHWVTATLHGKNGEQIIGGRGCGAACVSPFRVDVRVWDEGDMRVLGQGDAVDQDDVDADTAATGGKGPPNLDLSGVYSWKGVMDAYSDFHAAALKAPPGSVGLYVYTPRDCGMGNRMIDLATSYLAALLSRRILIVNWTSPSPLWYFIESNLTLFPDSPMVAPHIKEASQNTTSKLLLTESVLRDPRRFSELIGSGVVGEGVLIVEFHVGPVLRAIYGDFSYMSTKEMGLIHPELGIAIGDILRGIMVPSPLVEGAISKRLGKHRQFEDGYFIGVHARITMSSGDSSGGDSQIGPSSVIPLRARGQAMLALTTIAALRDAPGGAKIFLSTDNDELRRAWAEHPVLGGKLITSSDEGAVKHTAREEGIMGHAAAMADWWALSRCDALILTRQSTFGYTAAGMSGSVPHTVFEHKVERRFHCGPFELCDMTPTELGL